MQKYLDKKINDESEDEDEAAVEKVNGIICVMRCCQATDVDVESTMASSPASQTVPRHPLPASSPQTPPATSTMAPDTPSQS